jgi:apolipoprotein N-acyltransferase
VAATLPIFLLQAHLPIATVDKIRDYNETLEPSMNKAIRMRNSVFTVGDDHAQTARVPLGEILPFRHDLVTDRHQ